MEVAAGIHRIESSLGVRFMAQYVLVGDARTLLFDTGMPFTPEAGVEAVSGIEGTRARGHRRGPDQPRRSRSLGGKPRAP